MRIANGDFIYKMQLSECISLFIIHILFKCFTYFPEWELEKVPFPMYM